MTSAPAPTPNIDRLISRPQHSTGLTFMTVEVVDAETLSPGMRRVVFTSPDLAALSMPCANVAVRLFFALPGDEIDELRPQHDEPEAVSRLRTRARVYTVRRFERDELRLSIDFVLHGTGLASSWAENARPGDRLYLSGPRAHALPLADASHHLFAVDESGLPALEAVLESLPDDTLGVVFVSVADLRERRPIPTPDGFTVEWVDRSAGIELVDAIGAWIGSAADRGPSPAAWLAGELFETRAVREFLSDSSRYDRARVVSFPYWRRGSDATTLDEDRAAAAVSAIDAGRDPASLDQFDLALDR